ncbi:MAG: zinc dependent phospholipase C family protein [Ignavibacteriales bacterium]|nr:zinc dependent phospholipase C family protein [Ignavibacteriales bacterium]
MKLKIASLTTICALLVILLVTRESLGWGFWAHKEIHRYAIQSLPPDLKPFFEANADTIISGSIAPDLRTSSDREEMPTHFIDIDRYGRYPFKELPRGYFDAVKKYGKVMVDSNGTVPWRIEDFTLKLTAAMKQHDKSKILFYAINLGHYIADSNVPLHSVENYDGQLTNQKGAHSRWESRVPEMFGKNYSLAAENAEYIKNPVQFAFSMILESNRIADTVLAMDLKAKEGIPDAELYKEVTRRDGRIEKQFTDIYYQRYNELLKGMVERRMKISIRRVASYWYTAWVNAGKPALPS